jgi:L-ascorbate metabolism protein UlaG (beta-lactamase superfamily)
MVVLKYLGHACVELSHAGKRIIIDPFLTGNPTAACAWDSVKADLILVTHGHSDHLGDAVQISKRNNCPIFTTYELSVQLQKQGADVIGGNHGGSRDFGFAWVKITWAAHSSSIGSDQLFGGNPCGFVIRMGDNYIYHAGDTAVFSDMGLIGESYPLDIAMLPVGGFYTMGVEDLSVALRLLKPRLLIPIHYNTFPAIQTDVRALNEAVEKGSESKCIILRPGETFEN